MRVLDLFSGLGLVGPAVRNQSVREAFGMTRQMVVNSFGGTGGEARDLRHEWPSDCFVQGGHSGIVITKPSAVNEVILEPADFVRSVVNREVKQPHYETAYFEAFPKPPHDTFIRGEGRTLDEAEDDAWGQWLRIRVCSHNQGFDRRGYHNGYGFCTGCGMGKADALEPDLPCHVCGKKTYWSYKDGKVGCEEHSVDSETAQLLKSLRGFDAES